MKLRLELFVKNIEQSTEFYSNILGFSSAVQLEGEISAPPLIVRLTNLR